MADDISDLVVRARPEGLDETSEGFGQMQSDLEDTEEQMEETTGGLEELGTRWSGAMNAIVAGLAVGTGGLLTQVPVVGEAMGGLGSIIDALAYKIDQALRPALSTATDEFYDLSNEIYKSDGVLDGLDAVASKIGDIGAASISIAIEEDVVDTAVQDILQLVFPKLGKEDLLTALFSFNLSGAVVLTAIFGGSAIATSKILAYVFGTTIAAPTILAAVFASVTGGAILSTIFGDINMTEGTILTLIFGGIALTAALILGATFGAVTITAAMIVGTLFAGIAITADMILEEITSGGGGAVGEVARTQYGSQLAGLEFFSEIGSEYIPGLDTGGMVEETGIAKVHKNEAVLPSDLVDKIMNRDQPRPVNRTSRIIMDGKDLTEDTGRYRYGETANRGRFG